MRLVSPKFEVPRPVLNNYADEYIHQINSVRMIPKTNSGERRFYTLFNAREADHLFDCEKIALTVALRAGWS